jgi:hypothetical protein
MFSNRFACCLLMVSSFLLPTTAMSGDGGLRNTIDREIRTGWVKEKITPPAKATDSVFLRRIYLDLVGMIPSYEETTGFLNDTDPKKREKLIDKLLADSRFARQQSHVWDLGMLGRKHRLVEGTIGHRNRERFRQWLAKQFEANEPCDRIAAKILQAEEDGSQLFFAVNSGTDEMVTSVSRFFLATQIQCAKCHDHPFEPWTQKDYQGMAGFFVRTVVVDVPGKPEVTNKTGKRYRVGEKTIGEVTFTVPAANQKPGQKPAKGKGGKSDAKPIKPKFLNGEELTEPEPPQGFVEPKLKANELPPKPAFSRREKFIDWMTSKDNPYFAKAAVNRIWAQFMGRGFVHPVDDFNRQNEPSHPALLKAMESDFVARKFDLKWLVREIVNSEAYQATDVGPVTDALPRFYDRARIRPLSVEELTASLHIATGRGVESALKSEPSAQMLQYLGEPTDGQGRFQGSLSEHLFLHNGDQFRGMCRPNKGNLPEKLLTGAEPWDAKVERMFLSVLSRPATNEERERFVKYLSVETKDAKMASQRMEDAMWVLVSCSEFRFSR